MTVVTQNQSQCQHEKGSFSSSTQWNQDVCEFHMDCGYSLFEKRIILIRDYYDAAIIVLPKFTTLLSCARLC